jgi:hypothetical protein
MNRITSLVALFALVGCSVSEEKFAEQYAELACQSAEECDALGGQSVEDCQTALQEFFEAAVTDDSCEYDGRAAKKCLKEAKGNVGDCDAEAEEDSACEDICGGASSDDTGA